MEGSERPPCCRVDACLSSRPPAASGAGSRWRVLALPPPSGAAAGAHDPVYDDRALWPDLVGAEAFLAQTWEPAPVLVWAHPGTAGRERAERGARSVLDPALADRRPARADA